MNKLDGNSLDIVSNNVTQLKEIFPEVFSEDKIDFKKLEEELGNFTDTSNERYNFTWNGKQEAKKIAQTPSTGTLRPCKEDSKDLDTTQNLYIEGDNLEVLKLLQKSYNKKVKMIYIDPPYNTGKDFVYKDNFKDNIKNYLELTGQVDSEGNRLSTNSDTSGRYHSDWLNMMYPRLKLARNLLTDDGFIFISIDDSEITNLRKICDEIFGEDNFISEFMWRKKKETANDGKDISIKSEYILSYKKTSDFYYNRLPLREDYLKQSYSNPNNDPRGVWRGVSIKLSVGHQGGGYKYDIKTPSGKVFSEEWTLPQNTFDLLLEDDRVYYGKNNDAQPQKKIFALESKGQIADNLLLEHGTNKEGKNMLLKLFNKSYFDTPKPIKLIKHFLKLATESKDNIILDFFSGSATTAHSIMELNSEDLGNRKFVMVQLPEETKDRDYTTICEIGKERIRRAGEKILADNQDKDLSNLDIGFKVFKLDSSNIKEWDSDFDNLAENLLDSVENIKSDRTSEDLLYEILLKYGLDLTLPIEEKIINDKKVFVIGFGALVVCLDDEITIEVVEKIAELKEEYETETMRVVFKDSSFKDAVVKTNAIQVLKQFGIDEVVSV
ncbi:MAG: site-specific DNA-methyltransferase [Epsilonproteobacteria bacterium]|nr:MAG: site-specific DNA-methyltransferase [Campylobacterota bacterium]